ncbi:CU044_5270 family protein [Streptomyces sp. PA5.6]|uniref:CU044_5270 family protein n=1 Tax=Streptomyces sp. PA5.6 TaxID=3035651 RepID=UPI0039049671
MNELPERDLPPGRHHLLKEHLVTEIRQKRDEKRPKVWFRPVLVAGAVAATVVAGVLVASPFGDRAAQADPPSKATVRMLESIAAAAEAQPAPKGLRDDQFVYIKSKGASMAGGDDGPMRLEPVRTREFWLSVDGRHDDMLNEPEGGFQNEILKHEGSSLPSDTNYRNLQKLPTGPADMLDWIRREADGDTSADQAAFVLVGDLSYESLMPPKQAAALYLAASRIPGVRLIDDAVDAEGRHGVAIAREDQGERQELIFDRETKRFLGAREVAAEDLSYGPKKGDVLGHSAILERVVVDKLGERP